jgi:hypothetical protein
MPNFVHDAERGWNLCESVAPNLKLARAAWWRNGAI